MTHAPVSYPPELDEEVAALIDALAARYPMAAIRAAVAKRLKNKGTGRPVTRTVFELYCVWLLVEARRCGADAKGLSVKQACELIASGAKVLSVSQACEGIAKDGGLHFYNEADRIGGQIDHNRARILDNAETIRRIYNEVDRYVKAGERAFVDFRRRIFNWATIRAH